MTDSSEMVTVSKKDLNQDLRINEMDQRIQLIEQGRGSINIRAIGSYGSLFGLLFAMTGGFLGMWTDSRVSDVRTNIQTIQADLSNLVEAKDRLTRESEKLEKEVGTLRNEISETLQSEVIEQQINAVDGKMTRIISQRIEPRIKQLQSDIEKIESVIFTDKK